MNPVLFLGMYPWEYQELSDTVRSMVKVWAKEPMARPVFINPMVQNRAPHFGVTTKVEQGVEVWTPGFSFLPTRFGFGKVRGQMAARSVARYLDKQMQRSDYALYVTSATLELADSYVKALRPRHLILDLVDDNLGFPMEEERCEELTKIMRRMAKLATAVTGVSSYLVDKMEAICDRRISLLPNGVDFEHFSQPRPYPKDLPSITNGKRLCFVGAFTSWIDLHLLEKVAEAFPNTELLLVGPVFSQEVKQEDFNSLLNHSNVRWLGPRPYEEVPAYLHASDVLLLPRTEMSYSMACDPLKLYEYLATGKPVVSTNLPSVERFASVARIAKTSDEFVDQVQHALTDPHEPTLQLEMVQERSWEQRVKTLQKLLSAPTQKGVLTS
jgi:glycosyltransferase involved in cell wall biosynthesis